MREKIYIIAGESSGDFIGSKLMQNIKLLDPTLEFVGVGAKLMINEGLNSLFDVKEINIMGFAEILPHIYRLNKLIQFTAQDIINSNSSILITIDSPGFTYRVAQIVRKTKPDLKMIHIVAPSVWAYKAGRAKKYAALYDHLFVLLPFEPPYFTDLGLQCTYIGHPIIEQSFYQNKEILRAEEKIEPSKQVICVTAGSRVSEIKRHLPIFAQALNIVKLHCPNLLVIFVLADQDHKSIFTKYLNGSEFDFLFSNDRLKSFAIADVALAKSGTNTLEIAASLTPMIVAYKVNILSYLFIKAMIKIKYVSLINIVAKEEILPELLQDDCDPKIIANNLITLISDSNKYKAQITKSSHILSQLGFKSNSSPSLLAAKTIIALMSTKNKTQHNSNEKTIF